MPVDQKHITGWRWFQTHDQLIDDLGIKSGSEDMSPTERIIFSDRDHEVRKTPVTHENITDINVAKLHRMEPGLVFIVFSGQLVRASIGYLQTLWVHQTQVYKTPKGLFHVLQHARQQFAVTQYLNGSFSCGQHQGRYAFLQKKIQ